MSDSQPAPREKRFAGHYVRPDNHVNGVTCDKTGSQSFVVISGTRLGTMFRTVLHHTSPPKCGTSEAIANCIGNLVNFMAALALGRIEELLLGLPRAVDSTYPHAQQPERLPVGGQARCQQLTRRFP